MIVLSQRVRGKVTRVINFCRRRAAIAVSVGVAVLIGKILPSTH
jgi:hypothetical protein